MKNQIKFSVILAGLLGTAAGLPGWLNTTVMAADQVNPVLAPVAAAPASVAPASLANPGVLDARRQFALSMIETGNDDNEIGGAGEISRYQIMPTVWRHYSQSRRYRDPEVSLEVAQRHWATLYAEFKKQAHREPTDFDMYVLWNTHYGYYAKRGFAPARLQATVRDRAERFVNLVERGPNLSDDKNRVGESNPARREDTQKS